MTQNMEKLIIWTLDFAKNAKSKDVIMLEEGLSELFKKILPKKTKVFSRAFLKDLHSIRDNRLLILKIHLYLENYLVEIIRHKFKNFEMLEKSGIANSFFKKVKLLESQNYLDKQLSKDLLIMNKIRNNFVHDLNYEILNIDIHEFSYITNYERFNIRSKKAKEALIRVLIKQMSMAIFEKIYNKYAFLHFLDI